MCLHFLNSIQKKYFHQIFFHFYRYKNFCTEELNSSSDDIKQETIFYKLQLEKLNQTNKLLEQKLASTPDYKLTEGNEEGNVLIPIAATIKPLLTQVNQQIFNESQEKIVINLADLILAQLTSHFSKLRSFSRENLLDELSLLSKEDTKEKILNCFKQKYVINLMDIKAKLGKIKTIVDNVLFNYKRDLCWKKGLSTLLKEISSNLVLNLKMEEKWKENEAQNDEKKFQELLEIVSQINRKQSLSNDKLKEAMDDVKVKMDCLIKS